MTLETTIDNNIGESGAKMISEALKSNTSLTELDLGNEEKKGEKGKKLYNNKGNE